jgi:predicted RND superfamily exporter protein
MLKNILTFGSILGVIMTLNLFYMIDLCYKDPNFKSNDILGYAMMVLVFSLIFFGIRNYRKHHGHHITFGKALSIGVLTALLACTIYVVAWLIMYYNFFPDFIDKYTQHVLNEASRAGASANELGQTMKEMSSFKEMYKKPFFVIIITYSEVLPIALIVALISAFILKRKSRPVA